MQKIQKIIFSISIILFCMVFGLFAALPLKPIAVYTIAFIASSLIYIALCFQVLKYNLPAKYVYVLLGLFLVLKLLLIPVHPIGSDDYYRYVWDGKVQSHGINPYKYAPADSALNSIHSDILPKNVNFPGMKTIYPPVSEIIFYCSYLTGGESFFGIKIFLLIADLFTLWGIILILKKLNLPIKNILIFSLSALPLFQFFIDSHLDGLGLPFFVFSIFFYLDKKKTLSLILLAASICIKPTGLILLPVLFFNEKGMVNKLKVILIPAVLCLAMYLPYIFTGSPFQALMQFTENWTFNGAIFDVLDKFIHDNQRTRLVCGIVFIIFYLPVILSRKDLLTKIYLSLFILFICSPVVHPWYLSWLVVILPLMPRWSGIFYTALVSLTSVTIFNYQLHGVWTEYTYILLLEYIPVLFLFGKELYYSGKKQALQG